MNKAVTPAELNKLMTAELNEMLSDTGFKRKRIRELKRKTNECDQFLSFYFTRDRGIPGNLYSLAFTLSFSFPDVDRLSSKFLGEEYDAGWSTAAKPFYTYLPDKSPIEYKYCSEEPLNRLASVVSEDFHKYALSFYEKYDTLLKLESYFDSHKTVSSSDLHIVRSGEREGGGYGCCIAAVLCILNKWDKLHIFLEETDQLTCEQKERITEYASDHSKIKADF